MSISPLAPDSFPDMPPVAGLSLATAASGMKYQGRDDVLLICATPESHFAGLFTRSDTAAAPVQWSQNRLAEGVCQTSPAAILTNAGNANAFTGAKGIRRRWQLPMRWQRLVISIKMRFCWRQQVSLASHLIPTV